MSKSLGWMLVLLFITIFSLPSFSAPEESENVSQVTTSAPSTLSTTQWNLSADLTNAVIGNVDLFLEYGVGETWTLGPKAFYLGHQFRGAGIGVKKYFADQRFQTGWYTDLSLYYAKNKLHNYASLLNQITVSVFEMMLTGSTEIPKYYERETFMASTTFGYHWFFKNSLNINLGLGLQVGDLPIFPVLPVVEASLGYNF